jgi:predicted alpha/beta-fold hydrolase
MDLALCVAALEQPQNQIYQRHFVRSLKRRIRRKARLFPERFSVAGLRRIRSVREFDEAYTAPFHGFLGASDYYHRASAMRVIQQVTVPTLIISAEDDPFVPPAPFRDPLVTGNPHITVQLTPQGGHCGFVEAHNGLYDGYWAESEIVRFIRRHCDPSSQAA